jgi:hypothetical protein
MLPFLGILTWMVLGGDTTAAAVSALDRSLATMGGAEKLGAIKRIQREMVGTLPDPGQGESPAKPDNAPIREVLAKPNDR